MKIYNLGTTLKLIDLASDGIIAPKAEPVIVPALIPPAPRKRITQLKPSDYKHVMNKPRPPKPEAELTGIDVERLLAASYKRERRLQRRQRAS